MPTAGDCIDLYQAYPPLKDLRTAGGKSGCLPPIPSSQSGVIIMPYSRPNDPSRRLVLSALAALPAFSVPLVANAQAQTTTAQAPVPAGGAFSSSVGYRRPMMYLPLKE